MKRLISGPDPHLPLELERAIFEMAALARRRTIPNLILVAARVKHWVEPLLYNVVMVSSFNTAEQPLHGFPLCSVRILLRVIATKPPEFLQKSVQHLFLDAKTTLQELETICMACNGVVDLFHFHTGYDTGLKKLHALCGLQRLRRLTLSVKELETLRAIDGRSALDYITHLEVIFDSGHHPQWHARLCAMSSLTHIALPTAMRNDPQLRATLRECTNISCIVFLETGLPVAPDDPFTHDPRVFCLNTRLSYHDRWLRGVSVNTGKDFWVVAGSRYWISDADTQVSQQDGSQSPL
ncbi:hypothetical protein K438DRAFT_2111061 [Mycena galopus ATCC 62051]|nr:hypothetical protein K438DRAFT_2111061 [Mycena galopus ATCC 62051]